MCSERSQRPDPGDPPQPPSPAGPAESDEMRRLVESADRARGSIARARANLDGVMEDVRDLPDALKTNVCHIIEHAFDELLAAEQELSAALSTSADAREGEAEGADQKVRPAPAR
jgi:hypothetical protein